MWFKFWYLWKNSALLDNRILNGFKYVMVEKYEYWGNQKVPPKLYIEQKKKNSY